MVNDMVVYDVPPLIISTNLLCRIDDVLGKVLSVIQVLLDPIHLLIGLCLVFEMFRAIVLRICAKIWVISKGFVVYSTD